MSDFRTSNVDEIAAEAADWFARIRESDLSADETRRFARWLAESPVHVREYLGVSKIWGVLKGAQCWPEQTTEELLAEIRSSRATNIVQLQPPAAVEQPRRDLRLAIAAGVAVLAVAAALSWWIVDRNDYRTARGEQRSVVLSDGSVVQLNTLTEMVVHFDNQHRRIDLPSGEAYFRVAHDQNRPFEVVTPFARVRVLGTEFNIYNRPQGTSIAVIEGRVQVAAADEIAPAAVALEARQSVELHAKSRTDRIGRSAVRTEGENVTAWIQRRIVLDDTPLETAVAEFNRYNRLQMQIDGATLGALRISGVFSADDPHALMTYLREIQGVEIQMNGNGLVLHRNP